MILSLAFYLIFNFNVKSQPIIQNVNLSSSTSFLKFERIEIDFEMNNYANPYKSNEIQVYADFLSPSGISYRVLGFYYEDFLKNDFNCGHSIACEELTAADQGYWRVLFTPDEVGKWSFRVSGQDNGGITHNPSNGFLTFEVFESESKGFVRKSNGRYVYYDDGSFFFPVGENVSWYHLNYNNGVNEYGTNEYKYYIDKLSDNKANIIRVWLDFYEGIALIGYEYMDNTYYFDFYNQKDAWQLDWIMNYSYEKDVKVQLCLFTHGSWGDNGSRQFAWRDKNSFNTSNGGILNNPYDFFIDQNAIERTEDLIRYVVARWG